MFWMTNFDYARLMRGESSARSANQLHNSFKTDIGFVRVVTDDDYQYLLGRAQQIALELTPKSESCPGTHALIERNTKRLTLTKDGAPSTAFEFPVQMGEAFLTRLGIDLVLHHGTGGVQPPIESDSRKLHVHIFSTPVKSRIGKNRSGKMPRINRTFVPGGSKLNIQEEHDFRTIAFTGLDCYYKDYNFYIPMELVSSHGGIEFLNSALNAVLRHVSSLPWTPARTLMKNKSIVGAVAEEIIKQGERHLEIGSIKEKMTVIESRIRSEQMAYRNNQNAIAEINRQIDKDAERRNLQEEAKREFDSLVKTPKITWAGIENDSFIFRTVPLIVTRPDNGKKHLVGRFRVEMRSASDIKIKNMDRIIRGHHHPHVKERVCMGTMGPMLNELFNQGHLTAAAQVIISFLETCNPDDPWGRTVVNFPEINDE